MSRIAFAVFLALAPVWGQVVPGRFIVELADVPSAAAKDRRAAVQSAQARVTQSLASRGVEVLDSVEIAANALIVEAPSEQALAGLPGVRRIYPVREYRMLLDRAVILQGVTDAWAQIGGIENAGRGIKVGIIDTGIDATHPGLQDPDLQVPPGFPKVTNASDLGNTNNKVIVARTYARNGGGGARDTHGHGTGVAMIAAGRTVAGSRGVISGIAPKAWLGNYRVFSDNGESASTDAILKALDDAVADGMDVLNMSLGSFPAELPDEDILARAVERISASGVIVTVAAGNSGPDAATISTPATAPSAIAVGNAYTDRVFASAVRPEAGQPVFAIPASNSRGNAVVQAVLRDVLDLDPTGLGCVDLPVDSLTGRIALILRGDCYFEDKLRNAQRAGAVAAVVYSHAESPEALTMDTGSARLPAVMVGNRDGLDLRARIQAVRTLRADIAFSPSAVFVNSARLSSSSSKGPSVNAAIKPEILAVGTSVYTAAAGAENGGEAAYQVIGGTSLSSPMVAGAAAVLKGARPGLRPEYYRSLLINTAGTFSYDGVSSAPVQEAGGGLLNVLKSVRSTIAASPQTINFGAGSARVSETVRLTLANLGTAADTYSLSITPLGTGPEPFLSRTWVTVEPGRSEQVSLRFEANGLAAGAYQGFVVARSATGDSVAQIPYWYGVPSGDVASVVLGDVPGAGRRSSQQELQIRPTDMSGLVVDSRVSVTAVEGGGTVRSVRRSDLYPGFWEAQIRLGSIAGPNVFEVSSGGRTTRVTITGE